MELAMLVQGTQDPEEQLSAARVPEASPRTVVPIRSNLPVEAVVNVGVAHRQENDVKQ